MLPESSCRTGSDTLAFDTFLFYFKVDNHQADFVNILGLYSEARFSVLLTADALWTPEAFIFVRPGIYPSISRTG